MSDPDPRVGCVIVGADGQVLGSGHTQYAVQAHAEAMALRDAWTRGASTRGATAYVTLEPCAHYGRAPPCCEALAEAGISRVVCALGDPHPMVSGAGLRFLHEAGIAVTELGEGEAKRLAQALNVGFIHRMRTGRPWVRVKAAMSLDGCMLLLDGTSQWITGPESRRDGHYWRKRAGAILTGVGTVLADDPRLTVREVTAIRQPLRVVLDSQLRLPSNASLLRPPGDVLVYTTSTDARRHRELEDLGAEVVNTGLLNGQIDLTEVIADLGRREINELHVEAGPTMHGSFISQRLVDEFLFYQAPTLLAPGRGFASRSPIDALDHGTALNFCSVDRIGRDLRIVARPAVPSLCRV
jgi:diaminohydroxyphosphoribosylaminopyrimidine deaminase/5-amino-6-(5-phosphoribosylamino)uracil reductase